MPAPELVPWAKGGMRAAKNYGNRGGGRYPEKIRQEALRLLAGESGKSGPAVLDEIIQECTTDTNKRYLQVAAIKTQAEIAALDKIVTTHVEGQGFVVEFLTGAREELQTRSSWTTEEVIAILESNMRKVWKNPQTSFVDGPVTITCDASGVPIEESIADD